VLILASNSLRRRELLELAGVPIDKVISPNIDETPLRFELPKLYVERMARAKSNAIQKNNDDYVLTADTIVTRGRRIFGKPENEIIAESYLKLLSGCRHRVLTSVCLAYNGKSLVRTVMTIVRMKSLSEIEIKSYLSSGEWKGKAGGYAIQGRASVFIPFISGSYTNVVGLPLTETINLLAGNGMQLSNIGTDVE
jgi:septum formation protein